jgi:thiol-disulfide isomerase/thioredoxin
MQPSKLSGVISRRIGLGMAAFVLAGLGLYGATRDLGNVAPPSPSVVAPSVVSPLAPLARGEVAAFVAKSAALPSISFNDGTGAAKTLSDWQGKVVLLNLWATWCAPCRKEMPMLEALQKAKGGKDFEVVALNLDRGPPDKAKAFLDEIKVPALGIYHDPTAKLGNALGALGLPTTILIGRDGTELGRLTGPAEWDSAEAQALIDAALR